MSKQTEAKQETKQEAKQLSKEEIIAQAYKNPYAKYQTQTTNKAPKQLNTNIQKYRAFVHKAMEEGIVKYGVKVENQHINKVNDKKETCKTTLFSGYCFIEETTHEERGKEFEFVLPQLYCRGSGNNVIKRVCDEEKQIVEDYHIILGKIPVSDEEEETTEEE